MQPVRARPRTTASENEGVSAGRGRPRREGARAHLLAELQPCERVVPRRTSTLSCTLPRAACDAPTTAHPCSRAAAAAVDAHEVVLEPVVELLLLVQPRLERLALARRLLVRLGELVVRDPERRHLVLQLAVLGHEEVLERGWARSGVGLGRIRVGEAGEDEVRDGRGRIGREVVEVHAGKLDVLREGGTGQGRQTTSSLAGMQEKPRRTFMISSSRLTSS